MCETKELAMPKLLSFKFAGGDLMGVSAEPKLRKMAQTLR